MATNRGGGVEKARKFLWDDDDDDKVKARGAGGPGGAARGGFSTRDYAVDQSVNLMAMGDAPGTLPETSSARGGGFAAGLFRSGGPHSSGHASTNLSQASFRSAKFDEYGDAAPSTESEEYIRNDKRRRMNPLFAAIVNAGIGCMDSVVLMCGRLGPKGQSIVCCGLIGFVLLIVGISMAVSGSESPAAQSFESVLIQAGVVPDGSVFTFGSPQKEALEWLSKKDPAKLAADAPGVVERYALAVFWFNSNAVREGWTNSDNWMTKGGYCSWHGVECVPKPIEGTDDDTTSYDENGIILSLNLKGNGVEGTLVPDLAGIESLVTLDLSNNAISGPLETKLFEMKNLRSLILEQNNLVGTIPKEIINANNLHGLNLGHNQLDGSLPDYLSKLSELRGFSVAHNILTGTLPDLTSWKKIIHFWASDNDFSGTLADYFSSMTNLMELRLDQNKLSGSIHSSFHRLKNLEVLNLSHNQLTGGLLPETFDFLPRLTELYLYQNQLSGTIPPSLVHLGGLRKLDFSGNKFSGPLPQNMVIMADAHDVRIDNNQLTGTIHTSIGAMYDLIHLGLRNNKFVGTIPTQLGNCYRLQALDLSKNQLTGEIPTTLGQLSDLKTLSLGNNKFAGVSVPPQVCALEDLESFIVDCGTEDDGVTCSCCQCAEQ